LGLHKQKGTPINGTLPRQSTTTIIQRYPQETSTVTVPTCRTKLRSQATICWIWQIGSCQQWE
jgi:hypothetical protein